MRVRRVFFVLWIGPAGIALLVLASAAACGRAETPDEAVERERAEAESRVIARIDGEEVTLADFQASLSEQPVFVRRSLQGKTAWLRHFAELVNFRLLVAEARRQGLAADPDVQLAVRESLADQLWAEPALWSSAPPVSEAEIEAAYAARRDALRHPDRIELALLERPSEVAAQRAVLGHRMLRAALDGSGRASMPWLESFERATGAQRTGLVAADEPALDAPRRALVAAALGEGEVAAAQPRVAAHVAGGGGFVYMSVEREAGAPLTLAEARNSLVAALLAERLAAERAALLERWRERATVRIVDERYRALEPQSP